MRSFERHDAILALLEGQTHATIEAMAAECRTSVQTIRRDLRELGKMGRIKRFHGGARLIDELAHANYDAGANLAKKEAVARAAAEIIPNNAAVFISGGSTLAIVAELLREHTGLTVVTNNLHAAVALFDRRDFELHVIGGLSRATSASITGERAVEYIERFKVDIAMVGASGIDSDGTLLSYDHSIGSITKAMLANSRRRILVVDSSKFNGEGVVRGVHLRDFDVLVTDRVPNGSVEALIVAAGLSVRLPREV
jgi:DeoR family transcriptional regulator, glycerol-3-phosphate regulon repressor